MKLRNIGLAVGALVFAAAGGMAVGAQIASDPAPRHVVRPVDDEATTTAPAASDSAEPTTAAPAEPTEPADPTTKAAAPPVDASDPDNATGGGTADIRPDPATARPTPARPELRPNPGPVTTPGD
ncbi:hypothetical protein [Micromonospora carbonacea]|uniref:Uncharacterized protein n=1 Tax=Micromonospora carbonacea TaxID=47853 RepID=A0A7H8XGL9_9ACTN|nr:hypothetical protein [Micromonospora carbonacea]MBB5828149.1 putative membrane protein [Micromonospora carbonacea]QLD24206.1 hypothetical protein HXZ27_08245 [Micromonospora carbonacea]